jgi:LCP family protein required for cell wall assembly
MHRQQGAQPRAKSAFAAAFLSLIFPGLGQAYLGAYYRALGFAAGPILIVALLGGFALRMDSRELVALVLNPAVLTSVFVLNIIVLLYRLVAIIDAYRVAIYVNAYRASGDGRLGPARLPVNPLSVAGLIAIVLVMAGTHVAVARYDMIAMDFLEGGCVFIGADQVDEECELDEAPSTSASPDASGVPSESSGAPASVAPSPSPTPEASPVGTPLPNVTIPPWDGKKRLNILLIGSDQRPNEGFYNTDTLIVVSVDPETKRVAMFSLPRDVVDVPIPDGPARRVFGSVYAGKINSWFGAIRGREDLYRGSNRTRGYNGLKAILGELYGLDIKYFVEVNFNGFKKVVDAIGGVTVNVQVPVVDNQYPGERGTTRLYIPSGLQHMNGTEALRYARSRHTSDDFDRGARQQRLLMAMREQVDPIELIPRIEELTGALKKAVRTDIPPEELPKLLGLASQVDTRNIRSYVFAPPLYGTQVLNSPRGYIILPDTAKIRDAVSRAFRGNGANEERRQRLAEEGAQVWVLNGTDSAGRGTKIAGFLAYQGMAASAPRQRPEGGVPAHTKIVLYNAEPEQFESTIKYLESTFDVKVKTETDPSVTTDFVITIGQDTPNLQPPI